MVPESISAAHGQNAETVCANSSQRCATPNSSVDTLAALSPQSRPPFTEVLSACEDLVRLDDRIARVEETRKTLLQLHAILLELHNK